MHGRHVEHLAITSVMNGRHVERLLWTSVQIAESMRFLDPNVKVFFSHCDKYCHLSQYWTLVFGHYEQVHRTQKVCVSGPMFIGLFSLFNGYYHLSKYSTFIFNTLYIYAYHRVIEINNYLFIGTFRTRQSLYTIANFSQSYNFQRDVHNKIIAWKYWPLFTT